MARIAKQLNSLIALPDSLSALTDAQWHTLQSYGHFNQFDSAGVISRVMSEAVGEHSANDFGIVVMVAGHLNAPIKNIDSNYYPGQVLIADAMTGTIRVDADSHILRFNGQALTRLERENPQVAEAFYALVNQQQRERVLIKRLELHFGQLSETNKSLILSGCEWQTLPQGEQLAAAGESCNHWYMVIDGKLQGFFPASEDIKKADRQWLSGDFLGHRSLLSTGEHRATILAATDVRLVVFNRATFDSLWQQDHFKSAIASDLAMSHSKPRPDDQQYRRIAILPLRSSSTSPSTFPSTSSANPVQHIADTLVKSYAEQKIEVIDYLRLARHLGIPEGAGNNPAHPVWHCIWRWWASAKNGHVMLAIGQGFNAWRQFCLGNSDTVIALVNGKNAAIGNDDFAERFGRERWLIVLHDPAVKMPEGTRYWLRVFDYPRHLHLREDHLRDHARVIRTIMGKGVGVVFGGGHARCFAQLGTIAAMKSLKVSPDMIGGTSFGALLAAHIALEQDIDEIRTVHSALRKLKPFRALRWPGMSLSSDKKLDWLANNTFGTVHIEDFWLPYFCISTNLTTGAEVVHDRGQMTYAARATWSVSATPVIVSKEMLVDGTLVSNLPIDVMRRKTPGPIIAVDVSEAKDETGQIRRTFKGLAKWLSPREQQPVDSTASSTRQQKAKQLQAESILLLHLSFARYGMADFTAMDGLVELGYEQSLAPVKGFLG